MIALTKMMSSHLLPCAAAIAAALAVTGCAVPEDAAPERVGEAEARVDRQVKLGLVQLFDDTDPELLLGYGYITSTSATDSLQRWMILSNPPGNTLRIRAYNATYDPPGLGVVTADDESWADLVEALWDGENDTIYATCASRVYKHNGTYGGQLWRALPEEPPAPTYPVREPGEQNWRFFSPNMTQAPLVSPLVWPPTMGWIQDNAVGWLPQLDPGDGKLFQYGAQDKGGFFVENGVNETLSVEYFYMKSTYLDAGTELTATRIVEEPAAPNYNYDVAVWWDDAVAPNWDLGDAMAINGCVNHKGEFAPSVL